MIIQNASADGTTDLTFTVPKSRLRAGAGARREHGARRSAPHGVQHRRPTSPRSRSSGSACAPTPASRAQDVRDARRRGHQHPDDLDLGDQDLGRDRRQVHRARGARAARRVHRAGGARHADDDRGPALRHHAPRRLPGGGHRLHARGQAAHRGAARRASASTTSRAAGRARTRATRSSSRPSRGLRLRHAKIAAFGSTRRAGRHRATRTRTSGMLPHGRRRRSSRSSARPGTCTCATTCASRSRRTSRSSPTRSRTCSARVDEVIFDAEHFFDGYRRQPRVRARLPRGRGRRRAPTLLCLCDTHGGSAAGAASPTATTRGARRARDAARHPLPQRRRARRRQLARGGRARRACRCRARSTASASAAATPTSCSVDRQSAAEARLPLRRRRRSSRRCRGSSHFVDELANREPDKRQAYVGQSAFAHKGGLHVAAVQQNAADLRAHRPGARRQPPARAGLRPLRAQRTSSTRRASSASTSTATRPGGAALLERAEGPREPRLPVRGRRGVASSCSCSSALHGDRVRHFRLIGFRVIDEKRVEDEPPLAEATIMLEGPDGADRAHRRAGQRPGQRARRRAPQGAQQVLSRDRARCGSSTTRSACSAATAGTGALVRVLIESGDEHDRWGTVGVSHNVIEASWQALVDSMDYKLYKERRGQRRRGRRDRAPALTGPSGRAMRIYLDHNATAPLRPEARDAMLAVLGPPGNPSSAHREGARARAAGRGGARRGRRADRRRAGGDRLHERRDRGEQPGAARRAPAAALVTTAIEHASVLETARALASRGSASPVDVAGRVIGRRRRRRGAAAAGARARERRARERRGRERAPVARDRRGARVAAASSCTRDAAQAAGPLPVDVRALGVDLLSLSSHKLGGPRASARSGSGPACALAPLLHGGPQERGRRAGTENVAAIVGFGVAARVGAAAPRRRRHACAARVDRLWTRYPRAHPGRRAQRAGDGPRLPNTLNVGFPGCAGESLLVLLDLDGRRRVARLGVRGRRRRAVARAAAPWAATPTPRAAALRLSLGPGRPRPTTIDARARPAAGARARRCGRERRGRAWRERVVVAMSGGVDSAVAAARCVARRLRRRRHLAAPAPRRRAGSCCSLDDFHDARRVADRLGIPHYVFDCRDAFARARGRAVRRRVPRRATPNPCARCNEHVKFDLLWQRAGELGAARLATGHYARIGADPATGAPRLRARGRRDEGPELLPLRARRRRSSRGRSSRSAT